MTLDRGASRQAAAGIDHTLVTPELHLHRVDLQGKPPGGAPRNTMTLKAIRIAGAEHLRRSTKMIVIPKMTDIRSHPGDTRTKVTRIRIRNIPRRGTPTMKAMKDPRSRQGNPKIGDVTNMKVVAAAASAARMTIDPLGIKKPSPTTRLPKINTVDDLLQILQP